MTGSEPRPAASDSHAPPQDDAALGADPGRPQCEAYADSTGDRCQKPAMAPFPYCGDHKHLLDAVDLIRMGLKRPESAD